jgi:hypothetical protein
VNGHSARRGVGTSIHLHVPGVRAAASIQGEGIAVQVDGAAVNVNCSTLFEKEKKRVKRGYAGLVSRSRVGR